MQKHSDDKRALRVTKNIRMAKDKETKTVKAKAKATAKTDAKTKKAVAKTTKGKSSFWRHFPAGESASLWHIQPL